MFKVFLVVLAVVGCSRCDNVFPKSIERCTAGDTQCLATAITNFIQMHPDGLPEIGLKSIDPLRFGTEGVSQQSDTPLSLNITIFNGDITGWKAMEINKVIGFDKDPKTSKFELHAMVPLDSVIGEYSIVGRALAIPFYGRGLLNLTFENMEMIAKFKTKVETRNNEDYLKIKKIQLDLNAKHMHANFTNLFNDKAISDNTNALLNQYEAMIFPEIRVSLASARAVILEKYLEPLFNSIPYRKFFLD